MIICNMALEVENILPDKSLLDVTIDECLSEILNVFYYPELGVMLENVSPDGTPIDCFEGREINFIGFADGDISCAEEYHFPGNREAVRRQAAEAALKTVLAHSK